MGERGHSYLPNPDTTRTGSVTQALDAEELTQAGPWPF
jgi:hypothetical protein